MNTRILLATFTYFAAPLLGAGCGDTPMNNTAATFTSLKPVIKMSCALSSACHNASSTLGGGLKLDLETDPYKALVGAATQSPNLPKLKAAFPVLVVAGSADQSSCWVKMNLATSKDANYGDRMPQSSLPLDAATLANFKSWINGGAKND